MYKLCEVGRWGGSVVKGYYTLYEKSCILDDFKKRLKLTLGDLRSQSRPVKLFAGCNYKLRQHIVLSYFKTVYRPYPRRLERLTICRCNYKLRQHIVLSYFKTLNVSPVWGLNPRPPTRQSGALQT